MFHEIQDKLIEIEEKYNVRILYACESGSRAWGFPSTDSDYDVRFIYSLSKEQYVSIADKKDTIDIPVNEVLDINGSWEELRCKKYDAYIPVVEYGGRNCG